MDGKPTFKNRIIGHGEKPASEFAFNPLNWRRHPDAQRNALTKILSTIGWVTGVIENQRTGNLIDGHARIEQALKDGDNSPVPFTKVDLSPEEEKQILLLLDPIGTMATTDEEMIRELMGIVGVEDESLLAALSNITEIIPDFQPASLEDQGKLDEFNMITCPNCNHEFAR